MEIKIDKAIVLRNGTKRVYTTIHSGLLKTEKWVFVNDAEIPYYWFELRKFSSRFPEKGKRLHRKIKQKFMDILPTIDFEPVSPEEDREIAKEPTPEPPSFQELETPFDPDDIYELRL